MVKKMTNLPKYLIVHHTGGSDANPLQDSSNFTFDQCDDLHRERFDFVSSLGYYIGYHYYIDKQGVVTQGRLDTDEGAHTTGKNSESIGICLAGNFDLTLPTPAQKESLRLLLKEKQQRYDIPKENIVPHRKFAAKTCYGKLLSDTWVVDILTVPSIPLSDILIGLETEPKTMSKTIISAIVIVLAQVLPFLGITVGSDNLTNAIQTIITVIAGIVIWYKRVKIGDVSVFGTRKA